MIKYNNTIHRFPPKPYIKIDPRRLQMKLDKQAEKKRERQFVLMESKQLKQVRVVSDTMLIEQARRLVDQPIMRQVEPLRRFNDNLPNPPPELTNEEMAAKREEWIDATYVDPIKWLRDNQEEDKDSG